VKRVNGINHSLILTAVLATTGLLAADAPPAVSPTSDTDIKAVVETIQSLSGLLQGLDSTASGLAEDDAKNAPAQDGSKDGKVDKQGRPLKQTIAIITAGAAAGASIGAATKKGTQAIVIGAIAGAAAGLIYDRMSAEKKQPAPEPTGEIKPEVTKPEVASPETAKESGKLVAAPSR
jgi:hypothetical protein